MSALQVRDGEPGLPSEAAGPVASLDARRIRRALAQRLRYKYVQPRVIAQGQGWRVVSPNCSRNVDKDGGEIDIAWLAPSDEGGWLLFSRDHVKDCWQLRHHERSLAAVLVHLQQDPDRIFWP